MLKGDEQPRNQSKDSLARKTSPVTSSHIVAPESAGSRASMTSKQINGEQCGMLPALAVALAVLPVTRQTHSGILLSP